MLDATLKDCADLQCYLEKLQAIGVDFSQQIAESKGNEALAQSLKAVHFPDRH